MHGLIEVHHLGLVQLSDAVVHFRAHHKAGAGKICETCVLRVVRDCFAGAHDCVVLWKSKAHRPMLLYVSAARMVARMASA